MENYFNHKLPHMEIEGTKEKAGWKREDGRLFFSKKLSPTAYAAFCAASSCHRLRFPFAVRALLENDLAEIVF